MNWDLIQANWKQYRPRVKQRWGKLSDDDLEASEGRRDVVGGKIVEAYAVSKEDADRQLTEWQNSLDAPEAARATVITDRSGAAVPR